MVAALLLSGAAAYIKEAGTLGILKHVLIASVVSVVLFVLSYAAAFVLYSVLYYIIVPVPTFQWPLYFQQGTGTYPTTILSLLSQACSCT